MTKWVLSSTAFALALVTPVVASAQQAPSAGASCPPGSWFCAEAPQLQATPAGQPVQPLQPLPAPEETEPATTARPPRGAHGPGTPPPPPVVVYERPPPAMVVRPDAPPPYEYNPPERGPLSRRREWGLNLHLEGAMIGGSAPHDAGMGGAGAGLRFKPTRSFGLEADLDFVGGRDYHGENRGETAFTLNGLVFLNPQSRAQVFLLAGFGWSAAHVTCDSCSAPVDDHYGYFGGQLGGGLEVRVNRVLAFDIDLRGFIRGRTDELAQRQPEFTRMDAFGNTHATNTSGGALFTGGMTLYF